MTLNLKHIEWAPNGRRFQVLDEYNQPTGNLCYTSTLGEEQTFNGLNWLPYLWKFATNEIQYGKDQYNLEFASDKQIIKKVAQVLCSSFKLFVQAYIGGQWVDQPHGIPYRNIREDEAFRSGQWVDDDTKCTGFLSFPDAHLSFGSQDSYDLYLALECGNSSNSVFGIRLRAPVSGQLRFQVVLDGLEKLPSDWEWIWATYLPEKNKEDRKVGVKFKDLEWRWTYDEAPYRDISVDINPDQKSKLTITIGPYDYTANEWLEIYPDTFGPSQIANSHNDCYEYGDATKALGGLDSDGNPVGYINGLSAECDIGVRFPSVTCNGTADNGCKIELYEKWHDTYPTVNIKGIDEADPDDWYDGDRPSQRSKTTAVVSSWTPSGPDETFNSTPEIKTIIQELIDSYTYTGSQAMAFVIESTDQGSPYRMQWQDYAQENSYAAKLTIVYTPGAAARRVILSKFPLIYFLGTIFKNPKMSKRNFLNPLSWYNRK